MALVYAREATKLCDACLSGLPGVLAYQLPLITLGYMLCRAYERSS